MKRKFVTFSVRKQDEHRKIEFCKASKEREKLRNEKHMYESLKRILVKLKRNITRIRRDIESDGVKLTCVNI